MPNQTPSESDARQIAMAILPKVSAFLSVCGSLFIIQEIVRKHWNNSRSVGSSGGKSPRKGTKHGPPKTLQTSAFYRLMLCLSVSDCVSSIAWFATTWPIPRDEFTPAGETPPSEYTHFNVGTPQTCTAQAFFLQLSIVSPVYNALLACYYYATIRHNWDEAVFRHRVESFGHVLAIGFGLGTGMAGVFLGLFRNGLLWCWIAPNCGEGPSETPCLSGSHAGHWRWSFFWWPLWVCIVLVIGFMALVGGYVRRLDTKMLKYTRQYEKQTQRSSNAWVGASVLRRQAEEKQALERSKAVVHQGLFYAGSFVWVWVFGTVVRSLQSAGVTPPWALVFLHVFFTPSQGFFNFLVYIRPRVLKHYQETKKKRSSHQSHAAKEAIAPAKPGGGRGGAVAFSDTVETKLVHDGCDDTNGHNCFARQQSETLRCPSMMSSDDDEPFVISSSDEDDEPSSLSPVVFVDDPDDDDKPPHAASTVDPATGETKPM